MKFNRPIFVFFLLGLCSCSDVADQMPSLVSVELQYKGKALSCGSQFEQGQQSYSLEQFAFFLSNVEMQIDKHWMPAELVENTWQTSEVALLSYISSSCTDGKQNTQLLLKGTQLQKAQALRFSMSVPQNINHKNPLVQESPISMPFMFWSWQAGHKFLRADFTSDYGDWSFHLGSTGCESPSPVRPPAESCVAANRFTYQVDIQQEGKLVFHVDKLLDVIDMQTMPSCMMQGNKACDLLLEQLQQVLFSWE